MSNTYRHKAMRKSRRILQENPPVYRPDLPEHWEWAEGAYWHPSEGWNNPTAHSPGSGWRNRSVRKADRALRRNAMQRGDFEAAGARKIRNSEIAHSIAKDW